MSNHTPGPWIWLNTSSAAFLVSETKLQEAADAPSYYAIVDDGSACGEYNQVIDPKSADARLIAAAPDLLEACEAHIAALNSKIRDGKDRPEYAEAIYQAQKKMRKAIAKARGEILNEK